MTYRIPKQDINLLPTMEMPPRYHAKNGLMHTDRVHKCEIINIVQLTEMEKLFHLKILDPGERDLFTFRPGQFVMLEVPGFGEVPISIAGSSSNRDYIELVIRRAGRTTEVLHQARRGSRLGVRGPFGSSFPMEEMRGHHVLLVAGGLGLAPLRAPLCWISEHREEYRDVSVLYGAREPAQQLFTYEYAEWETVNRIRMLTIVDQGDESWNGRTGRITELFDEIEIQPGATYAIVCGPPVMFKFVCDHLDSLGLPMNRMFVSLERRMHCGMGKCCRCMVGSTFTCTEGPVFDYWSVLNLKEAI